eukprot:GHVQ01022198.1.p1 GENE.GHVQ01022198.1~~GHVQ01022198.1.p1  ORF type:complete len:620 (+),score=109.13 GHVQ01022198.1:2291-4150(+)
MRCGQVLCAYMCICVYINQLLGVLCALTVVDSLGRRKLLLAGSIGTALSHLTLALFFLLQGSSNPYSLPKTTSFTSHPFGTTPLPLVTLFATPLPPPVLSSHNSFILPHRDLSRTASVHATSSTYTAYRSLPYPCSWLFLQLQPRRAFCGYGVEAAGKGELFGEMCGARLECRGRTGEGDGREGSCGECGRSVPNNNSSSSSSTCSSRLSGTNASSRNWRGSNCRESSGRNCGDIRGGRNHTTSSNSGGSNSRIIKSSKNNSGSSNSSGSHSSSSNCNSNYAGISNSSNHISSNRTSRNSCGTRSIGEQGVDGGQEINAYDYRLWADQCVTGWTSFIQLAAIYAFMFSWEISWGCVMFVAASEILPSVVRGVGMSLTVVAFWVSCFLSQICFESMLTTLTPAGAFSVLLVLNLLVIVFVHACVPETKGRTLEEITAFYRRLHLLSTNQHQVPHDPTPHTAQAHPLSSPAAPPQQQPHHRHQVQAPLEDTDNAAPLSLPCSPSCHWQQVRVTFTPTAPTHNPPTDNHTNDVQSTNEPETQRLPTQRLLGCPPAGRTRQQPSLSWSSVLPDVIVDDYHNDQQHPPPSSPQTHTASSASLYEPLLDTHVHLRSTSPHLTPRS